MIYNIWGLVFFVCFLLFFAFYFQVLQKVGRGWEKGQRREKASRKKKPQGLFLRLKSSRRNCFLPSFLFSFFPLLDVKITTTKKFFQENRTHNIYTTSIWQLPLCICKKCRLLSTCTNFNTWSFYFLSSDSCIENSWRTKVDFRRGLSYLIFLHFFFLSKNWHISNRRGKDRYLLLYIYIYICNVFLKQH